MPDKIKKNEEGDEHLCKAISVKLAPKSTMKVMPHAFINVKNFLLYQIQHNYILNQQEATPKWTDLNLMLNGADVKVTTLQANSEEETNK